MEPPSLRPLDWEEMAAPLARTALLPGIKPVGTKASAAAAAESTTVALIQELEDIFLVP